ncbi:hypothetical protein TNIN_480831 [Trichonephila inaurata madagascariensis]|uniref:Uncharacterized protein n=1 Tax=Trichonephila inaurata madagascariensis TaxID=2747483 RepID=A0A8X6WR52_9ARAC|nr:hypothetical protein TNIN_480831 [Trichonephila inaurata madagascariensis]
MMLTLSYRSHSRETTPFHFPSHRNRLDKEAISIFPNGVGKQILSSSHSIPDNLNISLFLASLSGPDATRSKDRWLSRKRPVGISCKKIANWEKLIRSAKLFTNFVLFNMRFPSLKLCQRVPVYSPQCKAFKAYSPVSQLRKVRPSETEKKEWEEVGKVLGEKEEGGRMIGSEFWKAITRTGSDVMIHCPRGTHPHPPFHPALALQPCGMKRILREGWTTYY